MTEVRIRTKEAVLYGQLNKQQGSPSAHFKQFISYIRSALRETRNLLMYQHTELSVKDCVKMGPSELQTYYQKMVREDGEEWQRSCGRGATVHRLP